MKHKTEFEIEVNAALLQLGAKEKCRITLQMLSDMIGYNGGRNLGTAIRTRKLSDKFLVKLCKLLNLDLGKMFKLKVQDGD